MLNEIIRQESFVKKQKKQVLYYTGVEIGSARIPLLQFDEVVKFTIKVFDEVVRISTLSQSLQEYRSPYGHVTDHGQQ